MFLLSKVIVYSNSSKESNIEISTSLENLNKYLEINTKYLLKKTYKNTKTVELIKTFVKELERAISIGEKIQKENDTSKKNLFSAFISYIDELYCNISLHLLLNETPVEIKITPAVKKKITQYCDVIKVRLTLIEKLIKVYEDKKHSADFIAEKAGIIKRMINYQYFIDSEFTEKEKISFAVLKNLATVMQLIEEVYKMFIDSAKRPNPDKDDILPYADIINQLISVLQNN